MHHKKKYMEEYNFCKNTLFSYFVFVDDSLPEQAVTLVSYSTFSGLHKTPAGVRLLRTATQPRPATTRPHGIAHTPQA